MSPYGCPGPSISTSANDIQTWYCEEFTSQLFSLYNKITSTVQVSTQGIKLKICTTPIFIHHDTITGPMRLH